MSGTRVLTLQDVLQSFQAAVDPTKDSEKCDEEAYQREAKRIKEELQQSRSTEIFFPAMYLKGRDPTAEDALRQLQLTSKAFELNLRFKEIERLDEMHAKLWELLNASTGASTPSKGTADSPEKASSSSPPKTSISVEQYMKVLKQFNAWYTEISTQGAIEAPQAELTTTARDSTKEPPLSPRPRQQEGVFHPTAHAKSASTCRGSSTGRRLETVVEESLQRPYHDATLLGEVLFTNTITPPRPTMELFLTAPRNVLRSEEVDIAVIYQNFAKKVSLVKCEAELLLYDANNDGRLAEDEMEEYVRDLIPRIAALRDLREDLIPFYCCTASRRIFWDLDPYGRGAVRIDRLLNSSVMEEWARLQLLSEDSPQNWFGGVVTQQLYEKFLLLDRRNEGTLNVANLKCYKKGLPTVTDDGLPPDVSPLSTLFIDRYFETNVMMPGSEMDFRKFVDFVIAVEMLPQCTRAHFFWKILDLEGTGVLTPLTVNYFFRETHAKLISAGLDVPSKETIVQEVFDLIPTAEPLLVTREEFIRSPQAGLFTALIIDCLSFWTYENREQR